jgi:hypothetical protein
MNMYIYIYIYIIILELGSILGQSRARKTDHGRGECFQH